MDLKINCGGSSVNGWTADSYVTGGNQADFNNFAVANKTGIANPAPDAVYHTARYGYFTYTILGFASNRKHTVRLHFALNNPYDRIGDYILNGETVLDDFNVTAAGSYAVGRAFVREFERSPNAQGQFVLQVVSNYDSATLCGIEITALPLPPVFFDQALGYSSKEMLPRAGLELLHLPHAQSSENNSNLIGTLLDYSGNQRHSFSSNSPAQYFRNHLAGKSVVWHDDNSSPFQSSAGGFSVKQIFVVASASLAVFDRYRGLLSDTNPASAGILVGNTGTDKFVDLSNSYPGYEYRFHALHHTNDDQRAPVNTAFRNQFETLELRYPAGLGVAGLQIGQDRSYADRRWLGGVAFVAAYSEIKNECERDNIYRFLATNFLLWQRDVATINLFPFAANRGRNIENTDETLLFKPPVGNRISKTLSGLKQRFSIGCQNRSQAEYDAATEFLKQHPSNRSFRFKDYAFYPPRELKGFRTSGIKASDSTAGRFDYSFDFEEE